MPKEKNYANSMLIEIWMRPLSELSAFELQIIDYLLSLSMSTF